MEGNTIPGDQAMKLLEHDYNCPYCGETITSFVDTSAGDQVYVEDCTVCCSPIVVEIITDGDELLALMVRQENE